ncbi:MAG: PIN domain-containing protein [Candidatus Eremiobacterota bacterium]
MQKSLLDTGPIVALFDKSDNFHKKIYNFFQYNNYKLYITWPVITEISFLLDFNKETQLDFIRWLETGALQVIDISLSDISILGQFMDKYSDVPMDLADASLMLLYEKLDINKIITLDSDFYIYRNLNGEALDNIISELIPF